MRSAVGILRKKRRLEPDFGADPFAFGVRSIRSVVAAASAAKLRTEVGGLDLVELADLAPGRIANRARDVDFKLQNRHRRETLGGESPLCSRMPYAAYKGRVFSPKAATSTTSGNASCAGTTGTA